MKAIIYDNKRRDKWDDFVSKNAADFGVLQSFAWADFQQSLGRKVLPVAVVDDGGQILAAALIINQPLRLGRKYFYIPRGPILADNSRGLEEQLAVLENLFDGIRRLAKKERAIFLRFDPAWQENEAIITLMKELDLRPAGQVQPKQTFILDLEKSEAELLSAMKPKTRYNIKVAQKHGVEIIDPSLPSPSDKGREDGPSPRRTGSDKGREEYFEEFWRLMEKTSQRQEIISHSKEYYQKLLSALGENTARIVIAKVDGQTVVANIIVNAGDWCVYLHGASDYQYREKMAPFLLQWRIIQEAKKQGRKYYDFWGVDEKMWPGVTRFKQGFAPDKKFTVYIGAWDAVYSGLWYNLYRLIKFIKA